MSELFNILQSVRTSEQKMVLATIIDVEGSAYRKEGTMMLVFEDNLQIGLLSGGCLENDILLRAAEVFKDQQSRTLFYDMKSDDDTSWGLNNGCNGKITISLEYVDAKLKKHLELLDKYINQGVPVLHIKKLSHSNSVLSSIFIPAHHPQFGDLNHDELISVSSTIFENNINHKLFKKDLNRYFVQVFHPKPRLIIFGAGPDVRPLAEIAVKTGFYTVVTDWRPDYCTPMHFPTAHEVILEGPSKLLKSHPLTSKDSVIIMTHHFQKDQEILQSLIQENLTYLGVLGPRKRTQQLLNKEKIPEHLYSPIGLAIGAKGPDEIAISIIADVIKTYREKGCELDLWNIFSGRSKPKNGLS
ncbi:XdhC family protein [Alkalihalophilus lindianensis]|uniref:XdhC family protein n=1 Tax=Alkalihalophilus lindianensis TaxID=1630542 RepID=A0ABU3X843_9BACI|nr:XdhC family protein [Alkalihalophilus lindianensis]MDV2684050.1 XdhC family protein [Alkalihalophilus lindianensis]